MSPSTDLSDDSFERVVGADVVPVDVGKSAACEPRALASKRRVASRTAAAQLTYQGHEIGISCPMSAPSLPITAVVQIVDTMGLLLSVVVHPADVQDCDGAFQWLRRARRLFPCFERAYLLMADMSETRRSGRWRCPPCRAFKVVAVIAGQASDESYSKIQWKYNEMRNGMDVYSEMENDPT